MSEAPRRVSSKPSARAIGFWQVLCAALCAAALHTGCYSAPPPNVPIVEEVDLADVGAIDRDELLEGLATAETPRFLELWEGVVYDYETFDPALLAKDLKRIRRFYVARGYYDARVTAARVVPTSDQHVLVQLRVYEGAPVRTTSVNLDGVQKLPIDIAADALKSVTLLTGEPFDERRYDESKKRVRHALLDGGYALGTVEGKVTVDLARHAADVLFTVEPGPPTTFGRIEIRGLDSVPEERVRASLGLREGSPFSQSELEDARRALLRLGVFAHVEVETLPPASTVPTMQKSVPITVRVAVEEGDLRTIRLSGGVELDTLKLGAHLTAGWEHRNFLGGLRRFTVELSPGLVFYPTNVSNLVPPSRALIENRLRTELRQPAFLEGRTTGVLGGEFNLYPLLYSTSQADDPVVGYAEVKANGGAERYFLEHVLRVKTAYNWQADFPINYNALSIGSGPDPEDTSLIDVVVSYPELVTDVDLRDDPINTHSGAFFSNSLQVAGFIFGGDTSDVRVRPEARFFVPISKNVTLATRATVGLLFPNDYADTLDEPATDANAFARASDQQKLLFRAFFSGGPSSNRGYPYRGVGPHGPLGYLSRGTINCLDDAAATLAECRRPLGGLTLWEASLEVRFPIFHELRGATFLDASDVTRGVAEFRGTAPHLSLGLGLRYITPVGPIRLDVGYRIPGLQEIDVDMPEDEPPPLWDNGPPMTIYFGLGEAY